MSKRIAEILKQSYVTRTTGVLDVLSNRVLRLRQCQTLRR